MIPVEVSPGINILYFQKISHWVIFFSHSLLASSKRRYSKAFFQIVSQVKDNSFALSLFRLITFSLVLQFKKTICIFTIPQSTSAQIFIPYVSGLLFMYYRNGAFILSGTRCSSTHRIYTPELNDFLQLKMKILNIYLIGASLPTEFRSGLVSKLWKRINEVC